MKVRKNITSKLQTNRPWPGPTAGQAIAVLGTMDSIKRQIGEILDAVPARSGERDAFARLVGRAESMAAQIRKALRGD